MINEIVDYFTKAYEINPMGQIIGLIGFIVGLIAFLNKNDKKTKIIHGVSLLFWAIHYYLIGLNTAVAADFLGGLRNLLSIKYKGNKKIILLLIFLYLIFLLITYKNIFSLLPMVSGIIVTFAFFKLEGIQMRLVLILCSFMWLIYTYIGNSIGGVIIELFLICANTITIVRLLIDNNKLKKLY